MHPGVGIAVGHIELTRAPVKGHVVRDTERLAAHLGTWLVERAQGHQQVAVGSELADRAVAVVHVEDGVVQCDGAAVGMDTFREPRWAETSKPAGLVGFFVGVSSWALAGPPGVHSGTSSSAATKSPSPKDRYRTRGWRNRNFAWSFYRPSRE